MALVLVAEVDTDLRELVAFKLEQSGHEVIEVKDGLEALATARERTPDLLVLDTFMPEISGLEVCREVRGDPAGGGVRILLLTARDQESDVDSGFSAGADDFLVMPFSPRELSNRVQQLMSR